jgi:L-malate glycosyltransferase
MSSEHGGRDVRSPRIVCAHLYDDFSGSAKVFSHAISVLEAAGCSVRVIVGSAGESGFVRREHVVRTVPYRFARNRLVLLAWFALSQIGMFLRVLSCCVLWRADIVYANTVLVPGAVVAGWICRRRVVVHLHEVGLGSQVLFRPLLWVARTCAKRLICVSRFVQTALELDPTKAFVVHNSLGAKEWSLAQDIVAARADGVGGTFNVVMACSLKWYKGVDSFLSLADHVERSESSRAAVRFELILNCAGPEWEEFAANHVVASNITVILRPADVYAIYARASLVLNLSHRNGWVETFGMTLLEAMACGVPVVGPVVGGCTELFDDGVGGWRIDSRNMKSLVALVELLSSDRKQWLAASRAAVTNAQRFQQERFSSGIRESVLGGVP